MRHDVATGTPARDATTRIVPDLILVAPADVHSAIAEDGWMRLGLMAMTADALRALPGRAVVPNETSLAVAADKTSDIAHLRAATGAATIVTIDAATTANAGCSMRR